MNGKRRYKRYMLKQKLIGLEMMIGSALTGFIDPELGGCMVMTLGLAGLALVCTRHMVWMDGYFREMENERNYKWRFDK